MLHRKPRGLRPLAWFSTRVLRIPLRTLAKWHVFNSTVINRQVVPPKGRVIIAANHPSIADPPFLWGALRRTAVTLAKHELWRMPIIGILMLLLGHIPVKRGTEFAKLALEAAIRVLEHEGLVIIFPEGGCSLPDGTLRPKFNSGVARMAFATGAPIIPVGLKGTNLVKPQGSWRMNRKAPVTIRFGEPIDPADFSGENAQQDLLDRLRQEFLVLSQ